MRGRTIAAIVTYTYLRIVNTFLTFRHFVTEHRFQIILIERGRASLRSTRVELFYEYFYGSQRFSLHWVIFISVVIFQVDNIWVVRLRIYRDLKLLFAENCQTPLLFNKFVPQEEMDERVSRG